MKKIIFLDRDGTIVVEPETDKQLDSFDKLSFIPGVFKYLEKINNELGYDLVLVTNQDGLGTDSFPQDTFWPVQNFIIDSLSNENISFLDILIDNSFEEQNLPTRKPGLGLVTKYINDSAIDLKSSFVIGDRETDLIFANNIGCSSIYFSESHSKIENSKTIDLDKFIYSLGIRFIGEVNSEILAKEFKNIKNFIFASKKTDALSNIDGLGPKAVGAIK